MTALTREEVMAAREVQPLPLPLIVPAPDMQVDCDDLPLITLWRYFRAWGDQNAMKLATGAIGALAAEGCVVVCRSPIRDGAVASCDEVVTVAARLLGESKADLFGHKATQPLVWHRWIAMAVCREITKASYPTIGRLFGFNHTHIQYACRRVNEMSTLRPKYDLIVALFQEAQDA